MRARLLAAFLLLNAVALNQEAPTAPPDPANAAPQETRLQLSDGTALQLALVNTVSTQDAKVGDAVEFRVVKPVMAGGLVVIAEGAHAKGSVVDVQPPGRKWKGGKLSFKAESVQTVHGEWVPLRATAARTQGASRQDEVTNEMLEVVDWTRGFGIPLLPLFALQKGRHARFMAGSVFSAFLDESISADEQAVRAAQPPPPPARTGPAVIHVYHMDEGIDPPNRTLGLVLGLGTVAAHAPAFFVGKAGIAFGVKPGESFQFSLPAGEYWIRLYDKKTAQRLEVRDGEEYFVCIWANEPRDPGTSWEQWPDQIKLEPAMVGAIRLANTKSLPAKRMKDPAGLDPQKLRADPR